MNPDFNPGSHVLLCQTPTSVGATSELGDAGACFLESQVHAWRTSAPGCVTPRITHT